MLKQLFDYTVAFFLLIIFFLPIILLWIIASFDTNQNGIFYQQRLGKNSIPFTIYKFRTIRGNYTSSVTTSQMKITEIGNLLRKYKIDELPQLINILKGEMSFVGPRPDTLDMYNSLQENEKHFLLIKPGITGIAQLKYKNEEDFLLLQTNPEEYYKNVIWKDKVRLNNQYYFSRTFKGDLKIMYQTVFG